MSNVNAGSKPMSPAAKFAARLLTGVVESIARGAAKGLESVAKDAETALRNEAAKARAAGMTVETWRKAALGDVEDVEGTQEKKEKSR